MGGKGGEDERKGKRGGQGEERGMEREKSRGNKRGSLYNSVKPSTLTSAHPDESLQDEPLVLVGAGGGLQNVQKYVFEKHLHQRQKLWCNHPTYAAIHTHFHSSRRRPDMHAHMRKITTEIVST